MTDGDMKVMVDKVEQLTAEAVEPRITCGTVAERRKKNSALRQGDKAIIQSGYKSSDVCSGNGRGSATQNITKTYFSSMKLLNIAIYYSCNLFIVIIYFPMADFLFVFFFFQFLFSTIFYQWILVIFLSLAFP